MKKSWVFISLALVLITALAFYLYRAKTDGGNPSRASLLAAMPTDASLVFYANIADLRGSPFVTQLLAWAPQPQLDPDYARFEHDTAFNYQRDLNQLAVARIKTPDGPQILVIADGKFDRKKIESLGAPAPTPPSHFQIFLTPATAHDRTISFAFLGDNRIALTNGSDLGAMLAVTADREDSREWRLRFERLAGSPVFAVIRQDARGGSELSSQTPGGFTSPQLAGLIDQLQWITVAGKPEADRLRVVAEGEAPSDAAARQLSDFLQGIFLLAQAGLSGPQNRQQLDPKAREAYIDMFRGAEVSRIDRGGTKSVRVVFDVTAAFLDAVRSAAPFPLPAHAPPTDASPAQNPAASEQGTAPASRGGSRKQKQSQSKP